MNALDLETLTMLRDRLAALAADGDTRVVVLTGAGDRAFIAGADIKYMSGLGVEEAKAWGGLGHEAGRLLETMRQPTIAAINGFALGGGCELALACDLRYASTKAKLGQPEINLGIIPGLGRDAAAGAGDDDRVREGADPHRPHGRCGRSARAGARERGLRARQS